MPSRLTFVGTTAPTVAADGLVVGDLWDLVVQKGSWGFYF